MNFLTWLFGGMFALMGLMIVVNIITAGRWLAFKYGKVGALVIFWFVYQEAVRPCIRNYEETEKRAAEHFLDAWMAESAGFPEGRVNTDEWHKYVDHNRCKPFSPYLATSLLMKHRTRVKYQGKVDVLADSGDEVPSKVFLVSVILQVASDGDSFTGKARLWVARDSNKVVKFDWQDLEEITI